MAAPLKFSVSLPGQETFSIALQRYAENINDWRPFWDNYLLPVWYRTVDTHFTTQGGSTGSRWVPLSEKYEAWKQAHWPGIPTLVLSGALRESLTYRGDPNAVLESDEKGLTVGTRLPYAAAHQYGVPKRKLPARPPLRVTREFVLEAGKLLQEFGWQEGRKAGMK